MKSSPSPPPAPDPAATAGAQSQSNIATAIANAQLNRVNQQTPWGSINYTQGPTGANGVPSWSSQIQLSPAQQALLEQQQGMQGQRNSLAQSYMGQLSGQPLDFSHLHGMNDRGTMYNGAVNARPPINAPQSMMPPAQVATPQAAAMAQALRGASQAATPAAAGAPPAPAAPAAQGGLDLKQNPYGSLGSLYSYISPTGSGHYETAPGWTPETSGLPDYVKNQFAMQTTNSGGDGGQDSTHWGLGGSGPLLDSKGQQIVQLGDPKKWNSGNQSVRDMSQVRYDPELGYVTSPANVADNYKWSREGAPMLAAVLAGGAGLTAMGAGAAAGEGATAAGAGEAAGTGAFDVGGSAGFGGTTPLGAAAGNFAPVTDLSATAGNFAPVTDLSTQAAQPSMFSQMGNNFMQGRGLLGMNRGVSSAIPALVNLLRGQQGQGQGGGH